MDRNAKRPDLGNEPGAYLKIVRLENGWIVMNSNPEMGIVGSGKEWVFEDAGNLTRFIAEWASPLVPVTMPEVA